MTEMKNMAREFVKVTLVLWLFLLIFGVLIVQQPQVALLPLCGLYPGVAASGSSAHSPILMYAWEITMFVIFSVLAFFALWRKSTAAGIAVLIFFLISTGAACARVIQTIQQLH